MKLPKLDSSDDNVPKPVPYDKPVHQSLSRKPKGVVGAMPAKYILWDDPSHKMKTPKPHSLQSEPSILPSVKSEPSEVKSEPSEVQSEPSEVQSEPSEVKSEPSEVQSEPSEVKYEPSEVNSEPSEVKSAEPPPEVQKEVPSELGEEIADVIPWDKESSRKRPVRRPHISETLQMMSSAAKVIK